MPGTRLILIMHPLFVGFFLVMIAGCQGLFEDLSELDPPDHDDDGFVTVAFENGSEPGDFVAGEVATFEVNVENVGSAAAMRDITLSIDDDVVFQHSSLELDAGQSSTLSMEWTPHTEQTGQHDVTVSSGDDSDSIEVRVMADSSFAVEIDEDAEHLEVFHSDQLQASVYIHNHGDIADEQDILIALRYEEDSSESIHEETIDALYLEGDETYSTEFQWFVDPDTAPGEYILVVTSDDDVASIDVTIHDAPTLSALSGVVTDSVSNEGLVDVEVLLTVEGEPTFDKVVSTNADGAYEMADIPSGDAILSLRAPGLEPNYRLEQAEGDSELGISLADGDNSQDLTVEWQDQFDFIVDGGVVAIGAYTADGDDSGSGITIELPDCEWDGSAWRPTDGPVESGSVDISFVPDDQCFRINGVDVELASGELNIDIDSVSFPDIHVEMDNSDDRFGGQVNSVEVDMDWVIDEASGEADLTAGEIAIDLDLRFHLGGTVYASIITPDFGFRSDYYDCQLTGAWGGGDYDNPIDDDDNAQMGDYLHDSIELQLITGPPGGGVVDEGMSYDAQQRTFQVVDDTVNVDRMSTTDDNGGSSCGVEMGEDLTNDMVNSSIFNLPSPPGTNLWQFDFVMD